MGFNWGAKVVTNFWALGKEGFGQLAQKVWFGFGANWGQEIGFGWQGYFWDWNGI